MHARRLLREKFEKSPLTFATFVEQAMQRAVGVDRPVLAPEYLETRAVLGAHRAHIMWTFLIGHLHAALAQGQVDRARGLAAVALGAAEQLALDEGSWVLPWALLMLPDPPVGTVASRKPLEGVNAHSPLLDPRWMEAHLAWLRDADLIVERRRVARRGWGGGGGGRAPKGKGRGDRGADGACTSLRVRWFFRTRDL